jgi:histidinol-phosphate aminotransferase
MGDGLKISQEILDLVPYKPGKPISETQREYGVSHVVKLASNENSLGPSPKALEAVKKALANQHRYPDPTHYELVQFLSKHWNYPANQIGIGNGSDELLDILIRIYCEPRESILLGESAFAAYGVSAQAARVKVRKIPLKPDMTFDLQKMADYFLSHPEEKIRLIFIPNPNNPTGTYCSWPEIEKFLKKVGNRQDVLIVFDEAYHEFVRAKDYKSAMEFLRNYSNVILLKTFSKVYGLAGFRVGAMIAPPEVIEIFNRVRKPFNVNDLAQVAALAALQDRPFIEASQQMTWKGLDYFYENLEKLGLPFLRSEANFVLFDTLRDAKLVNEALLKRGIIMRPVGNYGFPNHLRLSVGLQEENELAIKALGEVLKEVPALKK